MGKIEVAQILKRENRWLSARQVMDLCVSCGYQSVYHSLRSLEKDLDIEFRFLRHDNGNLVKVYRYVEKNGEDCV